ncbi:hypothetical protein A4A49_39964 [Nicotiana attenuata]|uniref:Uncharacterized protein n=1 Tax=Nicotiana attenuata TaxID=49451 RepID=A0A1J6KNG1_NICAT|nr:hypothetical protein A4A49_39964 [Nicotiana attenuata]
MWNLGAIARSFRDMVTVSTKTPAMRKLWCPLYQTCLEKLQENYYKENRKNNTINDGAADCDQENEDEEVEEKEIILVERWPANQGEDPPAQQNNVSNPEIIPPQVNVPHDEEEEIAGYNWYGY